MNFQINHIVTVLNLLAWFQLYQIWHRAMFFLFYLIYRKFGYYYLILNTFSYSIDLGCFRCLRNIQFFFVLISQTGHLNKAFQWATKNIDPTSSRDCNCMQWSRTRVHQTCLQWTITEIEMPFQNNNRNKETLLVSFFSFCFYKLFFSSFS